MSLIPLGFLAAAGRGAPLTVNYLVIAGGGGSGENGGGGGGAGGYRTSAGTSGGGGGAESALSLEPSTNYTLTIGGGGAGAGRRGFPTRGANSIFSTITSEAGGRAQDTDGASADGGSGGGSTQPIGDYAGTGTTNQGFNGGIAVDETLLAGGGGGAGEEGFDGTTASGSGDGGDGVESSINGTATYRAGGGGGGNHRNANGNGAGGLGGGGNAGPYNSYAAGSAGVTNTGGGGGGGGGRSGAISANGGNGGSGIVIIKYPDRYTITIGAGLTGTTAAAAGGFKVTTITAGTGNISWAA